MVKWSVFECLVKMFEVMLMSGRSRAVGRLINPFEINRSADFSFGLGEASKVYQGHPRQVMGRSFLGLVGVICGQRELMHFVGGSDYGCLILPGRFNEAVGRQVSGRHPWRSFNGLCRHFACAC